MSDTNAWSIPDSNPSKDALNFNFAVNNLRSHLREKLRDTFEDGAVITWIGNGRYRYAAIRSGGHWYKTGASDYPYGFTGAVTLTELVERVFERSDVTEIRVATSFTDL